ncbi:pyruvate kinase [Clostridium sp.]|uniref:pyruvate kinase n=1 Tax=Clostridium sp. TaxID=1506 RepID=UPI0026135951|nr:pyruvate kinase [Clostridium sp.]
MKIIATIGPKSMDKWIIKELIDNGVNIIRFNCSHFNEEEFLNVIEYTRNINSDVKILMDLCGKKVRVSKKLQYIYKIYNNQEVYFCGEDYYESIDKDKYENKKVIPLNINSKAIINSNITSISMKDNTMTFEIVSIKYGVIRAKVLKGGIIRGGKGCNLSELVKNNDSLTVDDKRNIEWSIKNDIDIICQSFVEEKEEIEVIRDILYKNNNKKIELWAKVETPKGINNLEDILKVTNTILIGRGDLVPESGSIKAIELQERSIQIVKSSNKEILIGTHLLNSMKNGHSATVPEIEGIYNFIKKGIDGFLLAGETSIGKAPVETVKFLSELIKQYN